MIVSVSGAFSTGKTTVIERCGTLARRRGIDLAVIPEVARTVLVEGYALDREATVESYLRYIELQLEAERTSPSAGHLLSDRSLVDLLAYLEVNEELAVPAETGRLLHELVRWEQGFFDAYCLVPIEFEPTPDGQRAVDPGYQRAVDQALRGLLDDLGAEVFEVRGGVEERAERLLGVLTGPA